MTRFLLPLLAAVTLLMSFTAQAQAQASDTGWLPRHDYQYFLDEGFHGNLYPISAEATPINGELYWRAQFGPRPSGTSGYQLRTGRDDAAFATLSQQYTAQGYRLVWHQRIFHNGRAVNQGIWYR